MPSASTRHPREGGQIVVLMVGALVVMLAMVGLIIDGGNAWAQQRVTQNGTDAAAQAGATVLARRLAAESPPVGGWDEAVKQAVVSTAAANNLDSPRAYYTDMCGVLLTSTGDRASGTGDAAKVGEGLPSPGPHVVADCPGGVVGPVAGVWVDDSKSFGTYFAQVVGMKQMTTSTSATAVTGFVASCQDTQEGCTVLPVTVPAWFATCVKGDLAVQQGTKWPLNETVILPLCSNNPGNVGWLDWTPPSGGTAELVNSILTPNNPAIDLPSWQFITATGQIDSSQVQAALNHWDNTIVLLPLFDHECADKQLAYPSQAPNPPSYGCTDLDSGNGQQNWYRIYQFAAFHLDIAYTNGNNTSECKNVAKQCLIGEFVKFVVSGQVGPGSGGGTTDSSIIGVQLIR